MKINQKSFTLGIITFFAVAILAIPFLTTQASNGKVLAQPAVETRTIVQINQSEWALIDSATFDESPWVWANLRGGGVVTDQQIPENADVLAVDIPAASVTTTDRTSPDEVLINSYRYLPDSFIKSPQPISLNSNYQFLIFLPLGSLQEISADGFITQTEIYQTEKLGSAVVYSGSQEGNGVLLPTYMDGVLYNPDDFNSKFGSIEKFSYVDATDDTVIPTMYSFSTLQGVENFKEQNSEPFYLNFEKPNPADNTTVLGLPELNRQPPCRDESLFYEHNNFKGGVLIVEIGGYRNLVGSWWDQRISSLNTAQRGTLTTLWERPTVVAPHLSFKGGCKGTPNLRSYGFNDRTRHITVR